MFLAIVPGFPGPVYLICQDPFQIITGTLSESFYCFNQAGALVVCLERYFFDTPITFAVKTEIKFCTKFNRCFDLVLPALSKCKILFSGTFAISSWQLKTIALTKTVNHGLQFFSCFIQKWDILRITYVCRRTGCIKGWLKSRKECCKVSKIKCLQLNWINFIWNTWQK